MQDHDDPLDPRKAPQLDEARFRALETRIAALECEVKSARNDIQGVSALMVVVPVGLLILLRVWS